MFERIQHIGYLTSDLEARGWLVRAVVRGGERRGRAAVAQLRRAQRRAQRLPALRAGRGGDHRT